jgi:hypothetical protein
MPSSVATGAGDMTWRRAARLRIRTSASGDFNPARNCGSAGMPIRSSSREAASRWA